MADEKLPMLRHISCDKTCQKAAVVVQNSVDLQKPLDWTACEAIRDASDVDECIRNFLDDDTGDNATCMVRSILEHMNEVIPEGCTPADAKVLRAGNFELILQLGAAKQIALTLAALRFPDKSTDDLRVELDKKISEMTKK